MGVYRYTTISNIQNIIKQSMTKLILLFWYRGCPCNLFWCIMTSPEVTPNWCLFSALSCWYSNPSLLPSLKIILILLPLLLFFLLCLFFQESSLQHFKEPLIKRFSLFLNWCILKLYGWVLNFSARVMCMCVCECVCEREKEIEGGR